MKLVNLTPHTLNIHTLSGVIELPPSGTVARVAVEYKKRAPIPHRDGDIPTFRAEFGPLEGLPGPVQGTVYIVSGMVMQALSGLRHDVFAPGELIRDDQGRPVGCHGLAQ